MISEKTLTINRVKMVRTMEFLHLQRNDREKYR